MEDLFVRLRVMGLIALLMLAMGAGAQEASVGAALRSMAASASDIFVGQVVSIARKDGVVEVVFRVDQTVAGTGGGSYTLREWAGLWPLGMQRYHVGDRAMVFAQAASAAGFATPVNGAEGVVPVVVSESLLLDVSRLEASVVRPSTSSLADAGAITLSDAAALVKGCREPRWQEPKRRPLHLPAKPTHLALPTHVAVPAEVIDAR